MAEGMIMFESEKREKIKNEVSGKLGNFRADQGRDRITKGRTHKFYLGGPGQACMTGKFLPERDLPETVV